MRTVPQRCRDRLTPHDFDFIAETLSRDSSDSGLLFELMRDPDSLNGLLDHPQLLNAVLHLHQPITISPELYFCVLVRHGLKEAGIDHLDVADYVAATLAEHAGSGGKLHQGDFSLAHATYHVDFIESLNAATPYEQFYLHVHCGNQFLVLTGLFPRFIARREKRRGAPGVHYYEGVARESFRTAGGHPLADEFALSEVYQVLAEEFPLTRMALNRMAQEFLLLGA